MCHKKQHQIEKLGNENISQSYGPNLCWFLLTENIIEAYESAKKTQLERHYVQT